MLQWPERMDLWYEWQAPIRNNGNAGAEMAQAFYETNREEMERGAKTIWAARGVLDLMRIRVRGTGT